jgi:lauroyl/myristoyl acyltransferase
MFHWVLRSLSLLASAVPWRVNYAVSALVAWGVFTFWREGRESALENMRHVLGPAASEAEVRRTARRAMRNYCKALVEFLRLPRMRKEEIARAIQQVCGEERIRAVRDAGQGVLLAGPHFGNWDIAILAVMDRGLPIHLIADRYDDPGLTEELLSYRIRLGMQMIPIGMTMRRVYRLLRGGGVVAVAFDVPASLDNGGVPVQFFDGTIVAPAGPARLALRTGAIVAAGVCVRQPDDTFHVRFKPPIEIQPTGDEERDVQALTQAIARECEDFIRHHPDQWYMFRRMWVDAPTPSQG